MRPAQERVELVAEDLRHLWRRDQRQLRQKAAQLGGIEDEPHQRDDEQQEGKQRQHAVVGERRGGVAQRIVRPLGGQLLDEGAGPRPLHAAIPSNRRAN